jgi:hypothetical protein
MERYKNRTQITFSLPLQLKNRALDIIQKYNKETNDDINLSRFCVKSLNLGCNVFYAKTPVAFKEILDEIFLMNKNLDLRSRKDIAKMAKDYFNMYFNLYDFSVYLLTSSEKIFCNHP